MNPKLLNLFQKLVTLYGDEWEISLSSEGEIEICAKDDVKAETQQAQDIFDQHKASSFTSFI